MALDLGSMISAARSQKNPAGDAIANYQNQEDRQRAEQQRHFNNLSTLTGMILGSQGGVGGSGIGLQDALKQAQSIYGAGGIMAL